MKTKKMRLSDEADMNKMQEMLTMAEKENLSVRDLRERVNQYKRRQQEEIRLYNEPEKYAVILADPAWEYDFSVSDSRKIDNQYLPTSLDDMKRLRLPAADNCVLFMWATSPKLREALDLMLSWGFEYKTCAIWEKDQIGMGYYFRQKHELLLVGGKGTLQLPDDNKKPESVFHAPRTEHSEKPDIVYQIIETMYPEYGKLEMFAREKRAGWDSWGDES
jgi:N6-adenosine-specific RNA methylase IME4